MAKSTTNTKPKFKSYISEFTIRLDALTFRGRCVAVRKSLRETKPTTAFLSPEGNQVARVWKDVVTGAVYDEADLGRGIRSENGEIVQVDTEILKELKASELVPNLIELTVHDAAEVENYLFPSDNNAYVFEPLSKDPMDQKLNDLFARVIQENPTKALLGMCNFRNNEGLYRLTVWRGRLVLQRQLFPADVNEHETITSFDCTDQDATKLRKVFEKRQQPFDPDKYKDSVSERQRMALDSADMAIAAAQPAPKATADVSAALDALFGDDDD